MARVTQPAPRTFTFLLRCHLLVLFHLYHTPPRKSRSKALCAEPDREVSAKKEGWLGTKHTHRGPASLPGMLRVPRDWQETGISTLRMALSSSRFHWDGWGLATRRPGRDPSSHLFSQVLLQPAREPQQFRKKRGL